MKNDVDKIVSSILGVLSIVLGVASFFVFWWFALLGIALALAGICVDKEEPLIGLVGLIIGALSLLIFVMLL